MKKAIADILSVLFILSLASCASPEAAAPEASTVAPTATHEPVFATPAPTAEPEPLPTGYADLLQEKVDSGEWTLETGLVTMLSLFAGEIPASQADLGAGVLETEGTGVLQMAGGYLQSGTDQATKDELTRLMNIIVPSQEALERYSIPDQQASARSPKEAAPVSQDFLKCEELWSDGFPLESTTTRFPCFLFFYQIVGSSEFGVFYPLAWEGDDSKFSYYADTVLAGTQSISMFQEFGLAIPKIYFVFTTLNQDGWGLDMAVETIYRSFRPGTDACPVIIYPTALALEPDDYMQSIAHAVFHCYQAQNLTGQLLGTGIRQEQKWWSEGTAEYFSNLVYPSVNYEHRFAPPFSSRSTDTSLIYLSHENFAFFQFMGDRIGTQGVIDLLHTMPTTPTYSAQIAALAAAPGIEAAFEEFVRTVMDNTLKDTDQTLIPLTVRYSEEVAFSDLTSKVFSSQQPFVVSRYKVNFAGEREYELSIESTSALYETGAHLEGTKGDWASIPATVGGCDELAYLLYVITAEPGDLEVTETITTAAVTETFCDRCLLGSWEATNESVIAFMQSAAVGDNAPKVESAAGSMFLEFEATGTGAGGYKQLTLHQRGGDYLEGAEVIVTMDGASSGRYAADGFAMTGLSGPSGTSAISVNVEIIVNGASLGSTTSPLRPEDFPVGSALPTRYICDGDTLTTWPPFEGVEPLTWMRASP